MFQKPSLMLRIGIGKLLGFFFGLIAFLILPLFSDIDILFRLGLLFWLVMSGAVIGLFGVITEYPILKIPLAWWFRGSLIGGFMMFIFWLVAYEKLNIIALNIFGDMSIFANGAWIIVDGMIMGLIMAFFATRYGGEGKETVGR